MRNGLQMTIGKVGRMSATLTVALFTLIVGAGGSAAAVEPTAADDPRELIRATADELVDGLRREIEAIREDPDVARSLAEETVIPHLDFDRISRIVLGRAWRNATEEQRARFTESFRVYLTRTYVEAMVSYAEQIISHADDVTYAPVVYADEGREADVPMRIRISGAPAVEVRYRLHNRSGAWQIYDLVIEGLSMATTYRNTFSAQISRQGLDGVIDQLEAGRSGS